jgi:hypothetical protein
VTAARPRRPGIPSELSPRAALEFVTSGPIAPKNHYQPLVDPADPTRQITGERWEFCFDHADGGSTCLPVSQTDYGRYRVGERASTPAALSGS